MGTVIVGDKNISSIDKSDKSFNVYITSKELHILNLLADGSSYKQIADALHVSARTVEGHVRNVFKKTRSHNKLQAIQFAREHGLLQKEKPTKSMFTSPQFIALVISININIAFFIFMFFLRR